MNPVQHLIAAATAVREGLACRARPTMIAPISGCSCWSCTASRDLATAIALVRETPRIGCADAGVPAISDEGRRHLLELGREAGIREVENHLRARAEEWRKRRRKDNAGSMLAGAEEIARRFPEQED